MTSYVILYNKTLISIINKRKNLLLIERERERERERKKRGILNKMLHQRQKYGNYRDNTDIKLE